jgi:hypothetical protein
MHSVWEIRDAAAADYGTAAATRCCSCLLLLLLLLLIMARAGNMRNNYFPATATTPNI